VEKLLRLVDAPVGERLRGKEVAAHAVRITGGDGYSAYFMLPEIDSSFTDRKIIVAYSRDGRPIEGRGRSAGDRGTAREAACALGSRRRGDRGDRPPAEVTRSCTRAVASLRVGEDCAVTIARKRRRP
jgi:hypothetical protein